MERSKLSKLISILLITVVIILNFSNVAFGESSGVLDSKAPEYETQDPTELPSYYKPSINNSSEDKLTQKAGVILGIINVVGVVISVVTLMIIGIKYMFGSVEEKAEYKKTATMYLLGALLVFGVTTIPNILYKIGTSINNM